MRNKVTFPIDNHQKKFHRLKGDIEQIKSEIKQLKDEKSDQEFERKAHQTLRDTTQDIHTRKNENQMINVIDKELKNISQKIDAHKATLKKLQTQLLKYDQECEITLKYLQEIHEEAASLNRIINSIIEEQHLLNTTNSTAGPSINHSEMPSTSKSSQSEQLKSIEQIEYTEMSSFPIFYDSQNITLHQLEQRDSQQTYTERQECSGISSTSTFLHRSNSESSTSTLISSDSPPSYSDTIQEQQNHQENTTISIEDPVLLESDPSIVGKIMSLFSKGS